jgi:hypothetical protein
MPRHCGGGINNLVISEMAGHAEYGQGETAGYQGNYWDDSRNMASPQGQAIYLLNRGRGDARLRRTLLLCEARRVRDWQYLYPVTKNYDLRRSLIRHCLQDFPADPRVQWAVGRLSLAAGDYNQAATALSRALELTAAAPGGLSGFCRRAGLSVEHFHGSYACALTLLGEPAAAQAELALAAAANDGYHVPLGDDGGPEYWYDEVQRRQWQYELAQERSRQRKLRRAAADYAASRDRRLLRHYEAELERTQQAVHALAPDDYGYDIRLAYTESLDNLLLLHLAARDWSKLQPLLAKSDARVVSENWPSGYATRRMVCADILSRVALGQHVGTTAGGYPVADLLQADYLPVLLRSDDFAAALAAGGRPLTAVMAEIRAGAVPVRESYEDRTNGSLHWEFEPQLAAQLQPPDLGGG